MNLLGSIRHSKSPIGLDIGPRTVSAVQGQPQAGRGGGWRIDAAAIVPRPENAEAIPSGEELARLQDILYRQGFTGRAVVVAAPDKMVLSGTMELPPASSGAPVEQLAQSELARMHRKDLDALETAAWRIPAPARSGNFSYMMAAGCLRQEVERLLDALEAAELTTMAMDIRAWAMARACAPVLQGTSNVSAILDLGEAEAVLSVVHSGVLVYERVMSDAGIGLLRSRLRQDLDLDPEVVDHVLEASGLTGTEAPSTSDASRPAASTSLKDDAGLLAKAAERTREYFPAMIQEFRTALAYAVHRYPSEVDRVLVHGSGAAIPGLVDWISEELGVEIGIVSPAGLTTCPEWLRDTCANPALTTAMGLAQYSERKAA